MSFSFTFDTKNSNLDKMDRFGEAMTDGRLTAPSENKVYRLREAILQSRKLGRPLTESEMKQFEVNLLWGSCQFNSFEE